MRLSRNGFHREFGRIVRGVMRLSRNGFHREFGRIVRNRALSFDHLPVLTGPRIPVPPGHPEYEEQCAAELDWLLSKLHYALDALGAPNVLADENEPAPIYDALLSRYGTVNGQGFEVAA